VSASTPRPGSRRPARGPKKGAASRSSGRAKGRTRRKQDKPPLTRQQKIRKALKYTAIAGLVGVLVLVSMFYIAYRATDIPNPNSAFQAQTTNVYYAGGKSKIGRFATQNRESIPLADVPKVMQDAVVAAEDRTFWTNKGIDPKGIIRAAFSNAKGGATQGASTITQQYVKILYLTQERTISRKVKEAFLSLKIQQKQSKSEILEGYLNTIYFGRGAYGVQAAANAYFGIPAKDLNAAQSAMLAAVLNSPNYLSPDRSDASRQALLSRYQYVVSGMKSMGAISADEAAQIDGRLPDIKKPTTSNLYGGQKGFMLDLVKKELLRLGFTEEQIEAGGLNVTTTFTKKAMDAAEQGVLEQKPDGLPQLHAAAATVDVKTGALLGFYGGQDYLKSQLNWAALGNAPGSAFKPFALAAGLESGFSLKDTFQGSSPYRLPNGDTIKNEGQGDGHSYGARINLIKATQESVNTAYVDLTESIPNGPEKIRDTAYAMGIPSSTNIPAVPSIALGFASVSPITMANAYSTIANGGMHHNWFVVSKVTRASNGEELYSAPLKTDRAIDEDIAADTSYALQQVVKGGTGQAALGLGRPAAGKTGTATRNDGQVISSWFVGYTPQEATAVMYVRKDGRQSLEGYLNPFYGATYPARTWTAIMKRDMDGVDVEQFPPAANVDGDAPDKGHDPYTPPPPPTKTKTPKVTLPPVPQEPVANGVCDPAYGFPQDPDCPPPVQTPPPTPSSTPTATCTPTVLNPCNGQGGGGGGGGGNGGRVTASPDALYARPE
jgi:membrane peptidoglycan carboxypeptidase